MQNNLIARSNIPKVDMYTEQNYHVIMLSLIALQNQNKDGYQEREKSKFCSAVPWEMRK